MGKMIPITRVLLVAELDVLLNMVGAASKHALISSMEVDFDDSGRKFSGAHEQYFPCALWYVGFQSVGGEYYNESHQETCGLWRCLYIRIIVILTVDRWNGHASPELPPV